MKGDLNPRGEYPPEWKTKLIQQKLAERFEYTCEHCLTPINPETGETIGKKRRDGKEHFIAVHHIDGDKSNCEWTNLLYVCQACHLEIQGRWTPGQKVPLKWLEQFDGPPPWMLIRQLPFEDNTQLRLL
jgi:5-methylcytosine-specific restriction endonuclease McrA